MFTSVKVFATTGSEGIAGKVCQGLKTKLASNLFPSTGLSKKEISRFSNENMEIQVEDIRNSFVVVVHTQIPPVSDGLIELFNLLDAIYNASPADVLVVFPYMSYSRSEKKTKSRTSSFGCSLPRIINEIYRVKNILLLDPHDIHIKHFFWPAADEISAIYLLVKYLEETIFKEIEKKDSVFVFGDVGSVKKYTNMANILKLDTAYTNKTRSANDENPKINKIIGDVKNKNCILVDDEILTAGTVIGAAKALIIQEAKSVISLAVHGPLAKIGLSKKEFLHSLDSSCIEKFIITDSVLGQEPYDLGSKFTVLSVSNLLAEAIKRIILGQSISDLHELENVNLYY